MKENRLRIDHLIFGLSTSVIFSCLFFHFSLFSNETAFMLTLFNFLFASFIFPLNGSLTRKVFMLLVGNVVGLVWNYLFCLFASNAADNLGSIFNIFYIVLSPFVNLVWIVSFWSISLTVLANQKPREILAN